MRPIRFTRDIRPLSEFRANAAAFVQQVRRTRLPLILTQHGKSAAVLLDVEEYEREQIRQSPLGRTEDWARDFYDMVANALTAQPVRA